MFFIAGVELVVHAVAHRDDFAAKRRKLFMACGHRWRAAAQKCLHDEIENLYFAFGETVADSHDDRLPRHKRYDNA